MLKHLRNRKTQKQIYVGLALIIIPSFLITGVVVLGDKDSMNPSAPLGSIEGRKVTLQQYLTSYKATMRQAQLIYGDKYNQVRQYLNLKGEAWDRLLLLDYAKKKKVRTSDAEVVNWLQSQSAFQRGGQFDLRLYKMYVDQVMRASTKEFEGEIREMLTLNKLRQEVVKTASLSDEELQRIYTAENAEREIVYGILTWETQKDAAVVNDKELEQLYPLIKDRLTSPERVKIRYLFVPKEQEAAQGEALADAASPIKDLSAKYGLEAKETAFFSPEDAVPEFGPAAALLTASFELEDGQESAWIRTPKGAWKLALAAREAERSLTPEEARGTLREIAQKSKAAELAAKKLNEIVPAIEAEGFEKTLAAAGARVEKAKFGKASPVPALGDGAEKALKGLKEGQVSPVFQTDEGAAVAKVVKDGAFDETAFLRDKEQFRTAALGQKAEEEMNELLDTLRKNLKVDADVMRKIFGPEKGPSA